MADNYLERKMDEYRRCRPGMVATVSHAHPSSTRVKSGEALISYPPQRVLVVDGMSLVGQAIINVMRRLNCRVTFTSSHAFSSKECSRFAQATGSQYHPGTLAEAIEYLQSHSDAPTAIIDSTIKADCAIDDVAGTPYLPIPEWVNDGGPDAIAAWCGFALSPAITPLLWRR